MHRVSDLQLLLVLLSPIRIGCNPISVSVSETKETSLRIGLVELATPGASVPVRLLIEY